MAHWDAENLMTPGKGSELMTAQGQWELMEVEHPSLLLRRDNLKSGVLGGPLISPVELSSAADSVLAL